MAGLAEWALYVLAAVGFLDALYFTLVTFRVVPADSRWVPAFCRMDEATCARIVDTPYARVFGVPNSALGLAWYAVVAGSAAWTLAPDHDFSRLFLTVLAALAVGVSAFLAWALLARLKTPCPLCFLGHGVNLAILLVLLAA